MARSEGEKPSMPQHQKPAAHRTRLIRRRTSGRWPRIVFLPQPWSTLVLAPDSFAGNKGASAKARPARVGPVSWLPPRLALSLQQHLPGPPLARLRGRRHLLASLERSFPTRFSPWMAEPLQPRGLFKPQ